MDGSSEWYVYYGRHNTCGVHAESNPPTSLVEVMALHPREEHSAQLKKGFKTDEIM